MKVSNEYAKKAFQDALDTAVDDIKKTALDRIWGNGNVKNARITIDFEPYAIVNVNYDIDITTAKAVFQIGEDNEN